MSDYRKAAQIKLRFETQQGLMTVEDLFDLPLQSKTGRANLDDIAKYLSKRVRDEEDTVSFVDDRKGPDSGMSLAFDIVKDVIAVRKAENAAKLQEADSRARKQRMLEIIQAKKDEALTQKSIEELEAELAKM